MSDTPRTEKAWFTITKQDLGREAVLTDDMRDLERELDAAQARIKKMTEVGIEIQNERLARYEAAGLELPKAPERLTLARELVSCGFATEAIVPAHKYDQLRDYAIALKVRAHTIENETIERCATRRSVVPILPGEIPQEMFDSLQGDKDACAEAFRIVVRQTLDEYEAAILSLKKEG